MRKKMRIFVGEGPGRGSVITEVNPSSVLELVSYTVVLADL